MTQMSKFKVAMVIEVQGQGEENLEMEVMAFNARLAEKKAVNQSLSRTRRLVSASTTIQLD